MHGVDYIRHLWYTISSVSSTFSYTATATSFAWSLTIFSQVQPDNILLRPMFYTYHFLPLMSLMWWYEIPTEICLQSCTWNRKCHKINALGVILDGSGWKLKDKCFSFSSFQMHFLKFHRRFVRSKCQPYVPVAKTCYFVFAFPSLLYSSNCTSPPWGLFPNKWTAYAPLSLALFWGNLG